MRDMLGRPLFKFFRSSTATTAPPSSSTEYRQLKEEEDDGRQKHSTRSTSDPICIPKIRKERSSSDNAICDHEYMLVDINQRLCKSADMEKHLHDANMDQLDRIPVDFSAPSGPTIITDPDEVEEILMCGESRAVYENHSKIYGLASYSMYRAERWFHHNADKSKVERMLLRTGGEDGSFLVRVNERNCLILTMCHHQKIYNICISVKVEGHKTKFFIEIQHQFSNLIDLIKYYAEHQGLLLPCKLTRGVALRWPDSTKRGATNRLFVEEDY
ncbi:SH2 domain family protein [Acanthocheilonema viteae]